MGGTREIILDFCHGSCHLKRIPDFLACGLFCALRARALIGAGGQYYLLYYRAGRPRAGRWPLRLYRLPRCYLPGPLSFRPLISALREPIWLAKSRLSCSNAASFLSSAASEESEESPSPLSSAWLPSTPHSLSVDAARPVVESPPTKSRAAVGPMHSTHGENVKRS